MLKKLALLVILICMCGYPARAEILTLKIEADQPELHKILQTGLELPEQLKTEQLNRRWLRSYQKQLPQLVSELLQPYGYFSSQTRSQIVQPNPEQQVLAIQVTAGEPLRISKLKLNVTGPGAANEHIQALGEKFPLETGDILRQDIYEQGKALLTEGLATNGFLNAQFVVHQIHVFLEDYHADITLQLETGPRYRFGSTAFSSDTGYPKRFLRRFLSYSEGEIFSHEKLGQTQLSLLNADLFKTVSVTPLRNKAENQQVPIMIELAPSARQQWRPGIGYGTDTGARASLRYRVLNLFQRGHELHGDLLLAQLKQSLVTSYLIPDQDRLDSQTQLRVGFEREDSDSYLSRELFSEVEYQRAFSQRLFGALFLRLTQEYSEIGQDQTRSQMLLPGIRIQWRSTDSRLVRQTGLFASFELKGAEKSLFSDTSLLQLKAHASVRHSLQSNLFMLVRLKGGTTWHNDPLRSLPASLRFFAGGDRSVRGYGYQSLGPKNADGEVVGGKHQLIGNLELEKKFRPSGAAQFSMTSATPLIPLLTTNWPRVPESGFAAIPRSGRYSLTWPARWDNPTRAGGCI